MEEVQPLDLFSPYNNSKRLYRRPQKRGISSTVVACCRFAMAAAPHLICIESRHFAWRTALSSITPKCPDDAAARLASNKRAEHPNRPLPAGLPRINKEETRGQDKRGPHRRQQSDYITVTLVNLLLLLRRDRFYSFHVY